MALWNRVRSDSMHYPTSNKRLNEFCSVKSRQLWMSKHEQLLNHPPTSLEQFVQLFLDNVFRLASTPVTSCLVKNLNFSLGRSDRFDVESFPLEER